MAGAESSAIDPPPWGQDGGPEGVRPAGSPADQVTLVPASSPSPALSIQGSLPGRESSARPDPRQGQKPRPLSPHTLPHRPPAPAGPVPGLTAGQGGSLCQREDAGLAPLQARGRKPPYPPTVLSRGGGGVNDCELWVDRKCRGLPAMRPCLQVGAPATMAGGTQGPPWASRWELAGRGATGSVRRDSLPSRGGLGVEVHRLAQPGGHGPGVGGPPFP